MSDPFYSAQCPVCCGEGYGEVVIAPDSFEHYGYLESVCEGERCGGTGFEPIPYALTDFALAHGVDFVAPREGDAGYDLYCADQGHFLAVGDQALVLTGVYLEIPQGWVGLVKGRSSMASMGLYTSAGVIDSSYRGEIGVLFRNGATLDKIITTGQKVAQIIFVPVLTAKTVRKELSELSDTDRGKDGFGSTGK